MKKQKIIWRALVLVAVLIAITYFALSINHGKVLPKFWGVPFEFWYGILMTSLLVGMTYIAKLIFPFKDE